MAVRRSRAVQWDTPGCIYPVSSSACAKNLAAATMLENLPERTERDVMESQANKAIRFRQLHRGPVVLILPNAWDVVSARILEYAVFPALGTTSTGVALSVSYP